jgi:hypothetical protein
MEVADSFEGEVIVALQPFRITPCGIERGRHCLVNSGDALLLIARGATIAMIRNMSFQERFQSIEPVTRE